MSGKNLIVIPEFENGLVTGWDVKDRGFFTDTLSFRFRVGDPEPLKDEI